MRHKMSFVGYARVSSIGQSLDMLFSLRVIILLTIGSVFLSV